MSNRFPHGREPGPDLGRPFVAAASAVPLPNLLVIDDDRAVLRLVEAACASDEVRVQSAATADEGWDVFQETRPDVLLIDIMLPGSSGLEMAQQFKSADGKLPIIFITAKDDSDTAIEAMKLGAYDYLVKPLALEQVRTLVRRALEMRRLMEAPVQWQQTDELPAVGDALVGRSPQMVEVYKQIGRVAEQDVAVLICGESGTGKELIARAIYHHSGRREQPFLAVNCAALSETLLESELFGHEKGAFTGADRRRIGKFEQCNTGTIFLDEVGDMSPLVQSKVLRLLQEQRFERVGGSHTIETDVRIIAATNRDLEQMIADGEFRLDLYHRLNSFEIHLPPLRERREDFDLLIEHFVMRFSRELGKEITGVSPEAMDLLRRHRWPGNVRELQSVLRKTILMATGPVLVPNFLPEEVQASATSAERRSPDDPRLPLADLKAFLDRRECGDCTDLYAETLEMMERYLLTRVLTHACGNQSQAARRLGITRSSLRNKLRALGISVEQRVAAAK